MTRPPEGKAGPTHPCTAARASVFFSDGVFATPSTAWASCGRPYLAYAVTFLFIGQVWANHHVMFDHIRAADRAVLLLNILLLMIVAFRQFVTSVHAGRYCAGRAAEAPRSSVRAKPYIGTSMPVYGTQPSESAFPSASTQALRVGRERSSSLLLRRRSRTRRRAAAPASGRSRERSLDVPEPADQMARPSWMQQ